MSKQATHHSNRILTTFLVLLACVWAASAAWEIHQLKQTTQTVNRLEQALGIKSLSYAIHASAAALKFHHNPDEARFWLKIAAHQITPSTPIACQKTLLTQANSELSETKRAQIQNALKVVQHQLTHAQTTPASTHTNKTFSLARYLPQTHPQAASASTLLSLKKLIEITPSAKIDTLHTELKKFMAMPLPEPTHATVSQIQSTFFAQAQAINFSELKPCLIMEDRIS